MGNPTMSMARQFTPLPELEERHLFEIVWNQRPGAQAAREAIVLSKAYFVSILARRFSVLYALDYEDLFQTGCQLLLEQIDRVPRDHPYPGRWLYRCVQRQFIDLLAAQRRDLQHNAISLDRDRDRRYHGDDEEVTLYHQLAEPVTDSQARHDQLDRRASAIQEAVHRLPHRQQEALHAYYQFPFATTNLQSSYGNHLAVNETTPQLLCDRRKRAYVKLRKDGLLLLALTGRAGS